MRLHGDGVPKAYLELDSLDQIEALSVDGAIRYWASLAGTHRPIREAIIVNMGSLGGCYATTEEAGLNQFLLHKGGGHVDVSSAKVR